TRGAHVMSSYTQLQRGRRRRLLQSRAAGMRAAPSPAEARLWEAVRSRKLGVTFRRQVVLGQRYIADLVAVEAKLIVEVDGAQHALSVAADARRDRVLGDPTSWLSHAAGGGG